MRGFMFLCRRAVSRCLCLPWYFLIARFLLLAACRFSQEASTLGEKLKSRYHFAVEKSQDLPGATLVFRLPRLT